MINKNNDAYKSIGEVAKILDLVNKKKDTLNTHTIRFWEKEFKQIKPTILNGNRRYYNNDTIEVLKKVKYLLKDQGMTINGAKKVLNSNKSLKYLEALNRTTSLLDMVFCSFVIGFLPILLFFERIEKVPNLDNFNFFLKIKFCVIVLKKSSIKFCEIFLEKPICI